MNLIQKPIVSHYPEMMAAAGDDRYRERDKVRDEERERRE